MDSSTAPPRPLNSVRAWLSGGGGGGVVAGAGVTRTRPGPAAALPLSSDQISPRQKKPPVSASVTHAQGGRWAGVKIPTNRPGQPGKRSKIKTFTARSRRALLRLVNSIDQGACRAADFAFVTLTYPRAFPTAAASKKHLDAFLKRFEREHGERWIVWKLEPQQRGAPHFHCLVYAAGFDPGQLCEWVARAWHDLAGNGDPHHLRWHLGQLGNRPCVEQVRDWQGVASYAGKYLGKVSTGDEEWQHPGRFWGQRRAKLAPITMLSREIDADTAAILRRACVGFYESQPSGWYYVPGRQLGSGKHRAGKRWHARQLMDLGDGVHPVRSLLPELSDLFDVKIRPQMRRWLGRQGGWSGFMSAATFERLLPWAEDMSRAKREAKRDRRRQRVASGRRASSTATGWRIVTTGEGQSRVFETDSRAEYIVEVCRVVTASWELDPGSVRAQVDEAEPGERELVVTLVIPPTLDDDAAMAYPDDVEMELERLNIDVDGESWGECINGSTEVDYIFRLQPGDRVGTIPLGVRPDV